MATIMLTYDKRVEILELAPPTRRTEGPDGRVHTVRGARLVMAVVPDQPIDGQEPREYVLAINDEPISDRYPAGEIDGINLQDALDVIADAEGLQSVTANGMQIWSVSVGGEGIFI